MGNALLSTADDPPETSKPAEEAVAQCCKDGSSEGTDFGLPEETTAGGGMDIEEAALRLMVHEGTELSLIEEAAMRLGETYGSEDVFIKGGTGQNAAMNGLYFKLSSTHDRPVYKMVKKETKYEYSVPIARFLYFDTISNLWVISKQPNRGPKELPGCAYVEDSNATHPGNITAQWYVYCPTDKKMKQFGGLDEQDKEDEAAATKAKQLRAPVDQIKSVGIVAFKPIGIEKSFIKAGSMVRQSRELYGRPVYESRRTGQYLYWFKKGGNLTQGLIEDDLEGGAAAYSSVYQYTGHWILASKVGERYGGPKCLAYLEHSAVTPDQIPIGAQWLLAMTEKEPGNPEAGYRYRRCSTFVFVMRDRERDAHLRSMFDEDDTGSSTDVSSTEYEMMY